MKRAGGTKRNVSALTSENALAEKLFEAGKKDECRSVAQAVLDLDKSLVKLCDWMGVVPSAQESARRLMRKIADGEAGSGGGRGGGR